MKKFWIWLVLVLASLALAQTDLPDNTARVHYQRPDGAYEGFKLHVWEDTTEEVTWANGLEVSGSDDYGVYWDVSLTDDAQRLGFIVHKGDEKDPGPDLFINPQQNREVWLQSGVEQVFTAPPLGPPDEGTARVHYYRPDGDYEGFTLHVWEDAAEETTWEEGLEPAGQDDYGVYWNVPLADAAERLNFIVHRGDEKDPGPDMSLSLSEMGNEVWLVSGSGELFTSQPDLKTAGTAGADLTKAQAHWLRPDLVAWQLGTTVPGTEYFLYASETAELEPTDTELTGGEAFVLTLDEAGLPEDVLAQFPHLQGYSALRLSEDAAARAPELLRGQVAVGAVSGDRLVDATGVQVPGVLDALYAEAARDTNLGLTWQGDTPTVRVWAPTAQTVKLHVFDTAESDASTVLELTRDDSSGVWSAMGDSSWKGKYYLFETTVYAPSTLQLETNLVTDPYSLSLSRNSARSQFADLSDASLKPEGWDALEKPALEAFEDVSLYELHLRDFSVFDETVPETERGTYLAFTHPESDGMTHLASLAEAGLTHLHLLPTFDIATIDEDKSSWLEPDADLTALPPDSPRQQEAVSAVKDQDGFNWGYDPYHYTVPEGSYATDPSGAARVLEYRRMVQGLNSVGLRVVNDVVYNHTNASGQNERSVFDKIVPGYYHRLNADGAVETSTCCQNTATEHAMMEKLMVDSVVTWATAYKIDGFRFDLMGHHLLEDMLKVRAALDALTLETDGVDGSKVYLYGEGWNFGEVADNARGVNATQLNMGGTGIGTFNDRLRDAVRGGGPFDGGIDLVKNQGFGTGLYTLPNDEVTNDPDTQRADLLHAADIIRVGLAGNLADYRFVSGDGQEVTGSEVDYNGAPTGYTQDPQENIVYISAHDNQTLWDNNQYKLPLELSTADRVRVQDLDLSIVALSQGVPFFHAGSELLRSKSFDRNSYNSGDWFNKLDFTFETNNFGVGLPPADDNRDNWQFMRPRLVEAELTPGREDIVRSSDAFKSMLQIRYSSPLFRLETAEDVEERLEFLNTGLEQVPGVIVMSLADGGRLPDLDPNFGRVVVVFNATPERHTFKVPELDGLRLLLHPLQRAGNDETVKTSAFYERTSQLSVPAFTTAVFVQPQR